MQITELGVCTANIVNKLHAGTDLMNCCLMDYFAGTVNTQCALLYIYIYIYIFFFYYIYIYIYIYY